MLNLIRLLLCAFFAYSLDDLSSHPADSFLSKTAIAYGLPAITKTMHYPEIGVIEWTLSNHMRVCAHLMNSSDQEVRLQAIGPGGALSVPSIDRASAEFSVDIAIDSGIGPFNATALNAHLYDLHAELSTNVLAYNHSIEGACPTDELPAFFSLLHALFVHPRFDKAVLPQVIEREIRVSRSQEADAEASFERARFMMNTKNAPAFLPVSEKLIRSVSYDTAKKWYEGVFLNPKDMIVLIVGDYEIEKLRTLVIRYLATVPLPKEPLSLVGCADVPTPQGVQRITVTGRTLRELEPLVELSYFPPSPQHPFPLRTWETVAQIIESNLRSAFIKASGSTHGIDVALEFPLYPCIHPFWVTLGFRSSSKSIDMLIAVAKTTLDELYRNGTSEKEIERTLELQERNDAFWSSDKAYFIAHLASGYHLGGSPAALLPQPVPSLKEINQLLRHIQTNHMTISILEPFHE